MVIWEFDLFFILSGFILTRVHMSDFDGGYSIAKFGRFLLLRLARVYPLHLFTLFVFGAIVLALPDFTDRYEHPEYSVGSNSSRPRFLFRTGAWNSSAPGTSPFVVP